MKRLIFIMTGIVFIGILTACGNDEASSNNDEVKIVSTEFNPPETAEVGETVTLEAIVSLGEEKTKEAEVKFEYWVKGDEDNSTTVEANNNDDGTYTADVTFEKNADYDIYAHTDADDQHTMPKRSVKVGDGGKSKSEDSAHEEKENHADGFSMHFMEPDTVTTGEETDLIVHLNMGEDPLEGVSVKYEIWPTENEENKEWIESDATKSGEYKAEHSFSETGEYSVQIHVEDDKNLHEHDIYTLNVSE